MGNFKQTKIQIPYWHLILQFWRDSILWGFIFVISIGKYEKRALNFAIQRSQLHFNCQKV